MATTIPAITGWWWLPLTVEVMVTASVVVVSRYADRSAAFHGEIRLPPGPDFFRFSYR